MTAPVPPIQNSAMSTCGRVVAKNSDIVKKDGPTNAEKIPTARPTTFARVIMTLTKLSASICIARKTKIAAGLGSSSAPMIVRPA